MNPFAILIQINLKLTLENEYLLREILLECYYIIVLRAVLLHYPFQFSFHL